MGQNRAAERRTVQTRQRRPRQKADPGSKSHSHPRQSRRKGSEPDPMLVPLCRVLLDLSLQLPPLLPLRQVVRMLRVRCGLLGQRLHACDDKSTVRFQPWMLRTVTHLMSSIFRMDAHDDSVCFNASLYIGNLPTNTSRESKRRQGTKRPIGRRIPRSSSATVRCSYPASSNS